MLPPRCLSPASGKPVVARFNGGLLSSEGGILASREIDRRLRGADRRGGRLVNPRAPDQNSHSLAQIIRLQLLIIGDGYKDGVDANVLRGDPMFKTGSI
jgi:hypothetical protein